MAYIIQVVVFLLALVGALFKTVKEKQGQHVYSKYGLPVPTRPGWVIIGFLVISFTLSLWITFNSKREAEDEKRNAAAEQVILRGQLESVQRQNNDLRDQLASAHKSTIGGFTQLLSDQTEKHRENLEQFSSLLTRQEELGTSTVKNINRVFGGVGSGLTLEFVLQIPAQQPILESYVRRLATPPPTFVVMNMGPDDPLWPKADLTDPEHKLAYFFGFIHAEVYFYKYPITPTEFKKGRLSDLFLFSAAGIQKGQSSLPTQSSVVTYVVDKYFSFRAFDSKPFLTAAGGRIRSVDDLPGSTIVVVIDDWTESLEFTVEGIAIFNPLARGIGIEKFTFAYRDGRDTVFIGTVSKM